MDFRDSRYRFFLIAIVLFFILAVIFGFFSQFFQFEKNSEPINSPTQTPKPTSKPSLTPNPTSSSHIYVTGIKIFGGDLQGNTVQFNTLNVGESRNISFYAQSTSNGPVKLSFLVTNWSPPGIGSFMSLKWDYNGLQIEPNQTIFLTIMLTAPLSTDFETYLASNNVTTFSFNLEITAQAKV